MRISEKIQKKCTGFFQNQDGNFAVVTSLMLIPLAIAGGVALDFSRQTLVSTKLQNATDAAALAGAIAGTTDMALLEKTTEQIFLKNLSEEIASDQVKLTITPTQSDSVIVSAEVGISTVIPGLSSSPLFKASVVSEASTSNAGGGALEIVLALDETQSMAGLKFSSALSTIESTLETLEAKSGNDGFYVTLLPFNDRVNIGTANDQFLGGAAGAGWNGCVEPREAPKGAFPFHRDDEIALTAHFAESIPEVTGGLAARGGGYPHCATMPIIGPTNNIADVSTSGFEFGNTGTGRFEEAMAWAWRLLSPKWKGDWGPIDYPADFSSDTRKVVIYLADGRSSAYSYELI